MGEHAQRRLIRKLDLELFLANVKPNPTPDAKLEQYTTGEQAAAIMLYLAAYTYGDIVGRRVLDLGCGTGRLALGAAFLGADSVVGVDIDRDSVNVAAQNAADVDCQSQVNWVVGDIDAVTGTFDTVIQNPPFGVQKLHADRRFLEKALELGCTIYSLHNHPYVDKHLLAALKSGGAQLIQVRASPFLSRFIESHGGSILSVYALPMAIPHMFDFHTKARQEIVMDLYVIRKQAETQ